MTSAWVRIATIETCATDQYQIGNYTKYYTDCLGKMLRTPTAPGGPVQEFALPPAGATVASGFGWDQIASHAPAPGASRHSIQPALREEDDPKKMTWLPPHAHSWDSSKK